MQFSLREHCCQVPAPQNFRPAPGTVCCAQFSGTTPCSVFMISICLFYRLNIMRDYSGFKKIQHSARKALSSVYYPKWLTCFENLHSDPFVFLPEDKQWYRSKVLAYPSEERVCVGYLDFGNSEEVDLVNLRAISTSLLALPMQAMPCGLAGSTGVLEMSY